MPWGSCEGEVADLDLTKHVGQQFVGHSSQAKQLKKTNKLNGRSTVHSDTSLIEVSEYPLSPCSIPLNSFHDVHLLAEKETKNGRNFFS